MYQRTEKSRKRENEREPERASVRAREKVNARMCVYVRDRQSVRDNVRE